MEFHSPPLICGGGGTEMDILKLGNTKPKPSARLLATFGISPVHLPLFVFSVIKSYFRRPQEKSVTVV